MASDGRASTNSGGTFDPEQILAAFAAHGATDVGRVDIIFTPSGSEGFDDLRVGAERCMLHGKPPYAASLADTLRMKEVANRPQDRQDVVVIREMMRRDAGVMQLGSATRGATLSHLHTLTRSRVCSHGAVDRV